MISEQDRIKAEEQRILCSNNYLNHDYDDIEQAIENSPEPNFD